MLLSIAHDDEDLRNMIAQGQSVTGEQSVPSATDAH
jgi:hypothetical protein